jgi:hypothetical protein
MMSEENKPIVVTQILKPVVWLEQNMFGGISVFVQYPKLQKFNYCTFNYAFPYTDNSSVREAAERMAISLGSDEPVNYVQPDVAVPVEPEQSEPVGYLNKHTGQFF